MLANLTTVPHYEGLCCFRNSRLLCRWQWQEKGLNAAAGFLTYWLHEAPHLTEVPGSTSRSPEVKPSANKLSFTKANRHLIFIFYFFLNWHLGRLANLRHSHSSHRYSWSPSRVPSPVLANRRHSREQKDLALAGQGAD